MNLPYYNNFEYTYTDRMYITLPKNVKKYSYVETILSDDGNSNITDQVLVGIFVCRTE